MRKYFLLIVFVMSICTASLFAQADVIRIVPLQIVAPETQYDLADTILEQIIAFYKNADDIAVAGESMIDRTMHEIGVDECFDAQCAREVGRALQSDKVLFIVLRVFDEEFQLEINLLDVYHHDADRTADVRAYDKDELLYRVKNTCNDFLNSMYDELTYTTTPYTGRSDTVRHLVAVSALGTYMDLKQLRSLVTNISDGGLPKRLNWGVSGEYRISLSDWRIGMGFDYLLGNETTTEINSDLTDVPLNTGILSFTSFRLSLIGEWMPLHTGHFYFGIYAQPTFALLMLAQTVRGQDTTYKYNAREWGSEFGLSITIGYHSGFKFRFGYDVLGDNASGSVGRAGFFFRL